MCQYKVVLFQCEWYNTGNKTSRRRMIRIETHCTSINVQSRWYQNDPFILPSQAKQVFYLYDTKWGEPWHFVQCVQYGRVFDVPKVGDAESNDQTEADEAFQQEAISEVVPIDVEDNVQYCKGGIEVKNIPKGLGKQRDNNEDEVHNIPDSDMDPDIDYDI